jgi:hypothetical protein
MDMFAEVLNLLNLKTNKGELWRLAFGLCSCLFANLEGPALKVRDPRVDFFLDPTDRIRAKLNGLRKRVGLNTPPNGGIAEAGLGQDLGLT